jgi:hypothetical protein
MGVTIRKTKRKIINKSRKKKDTNKEKKGLGDGMSYEFHHHYQHL